MLFKGYLSRLDKHIATRFLIIYGCKRVKGGARVEWVWPVKDVKACCKRISALAFTMLKRRTPIVFALRNGSERNWQSRQLSTWLSMELICPLWWIWCRHAVHSVVICGIARCTWTEVSNNIGANTNNSSRAVILLLYLCLFIACKVKRILLNRLAITY